MFGKYAEYAEKCLPGAKERRAPIVPPRARRERMEEHDWREYRGYLTCFKCGVIKRKDGKNNPCKGVVRVTLRENQPAEGGR